MAIRYSTIILTLLLTVPALAQTGPNYKAIKQFPLDDRTVYFPSSDGGIGHCWARKDKGRRFIVHGKLTYSEQHKSYTLKADQLSVYPLSRSKAADGDDVVAIGADVSEPGPESTKKTHTKTNTK